MQIEEIYHEFQGYVNSNIYGDIKENTSTIKLFKTLLLVNSKIVNCDVGRGEGSSYTVRVIADHRGNTMELGATSLPLPNTTQTRVATNILRKIWRGLSRDSIIGWEPLMNGDLTLDT